MTYISLANKYRPQTFKEVVGQESIETTLMNAVKSGRVAPAYLFYGPRGCGKTTTARLLAKALNCQHGPTDEPCGECPQCKEIAASSDLDVLELDAASNTQVDKIREVILDTVSLAAGRDRYKIFILDEVHMLSKSSFNALLKTLEEPPSHVVFILATTEFNKVPLTITSRCQTFRFKPIEEKEIITHLLDLAGAENFELTDGAAKQIAKNAGGALRDALTILDRALSFSNGRVDEELIAKMLGLMPRDVVKETAFALVRKDEKKLHEVFEMVKREGFDALALLKDLKTAFGEIFYFTLGSGAAPFDGAEDIIKETSPSFIAGLTRKLSKLYDEVKYSDTPALAAEVGLFTLMQATLDIEGLIARLEALEKGEVSDITPSSSGNNQAEEKLETKPARKIKKIEAKPAEKEEITEQEQKATQDATPFNPVTALPVLKN
ncbi:MAG: DNA polymerase III subunit gamma/tau, partial [Elusimicrobiaceae bacterium]|nr:DNA polymerase III subunit gamma/tau [Elusimicrobiaceae bacterium]